MMESRKHCRCPVKGLVTLAYLPLLTLRVATSSSLWVGGTAPTVLQCAWAQRCRRTDNMSHAIRNQHEVCHNVLVSLQPEQWLYEIHFIGDRPCYPKVTAAPALKRLDCEDSLLVSDMSLMLHRVVFWDWRKGWTRGTECSIALRWHQILQLFNLGPVTDVTHPVCTLIALTLYFQCL